MALLAEWNIPHWSQPPLAPLAPLAAAPVVELAGEAADWIAVASAEHVRRGVALGIVQIWHGSAAPLRRVVPGSRIAFYSPTVSFRGRDRLQCFTALGVVLDEEIFQVDLGDGFRPHRRRARYLHRREAPIAALLDLPGFALSGPGWDQRLRFGLLRVDKPSMDSIARAMGASVLGDP